MKRYIKYVLVAAVAAVCATSCSTGGWSVTGKFGGVAGKSVKLESADNGRWIAIDSATITDDGTFAFKQERADYADIYRLTVENRSVYFPIDSIEHITIVADFANLDKTTRIAGSPSAETMQAVNERISQALGNNGLLTAEADSLLKRDIAEMLQNDWGSIVAYYTINKTIGEAPLFNPANKFDRSIINAVANSFCIAKPNDPRSELLKNTVLTHRRNYDAAPTASPTPIYVEEVPFMEIELLDKEGKKRSLTEEWGKGKLIVLNFTVYDAPESPAFNAQLSKVYDEFAKRGMEIYQVVCDDDEYLWRQGAKNIPWISVYNAPTDLASVLLRYNVGALPTTFVIDSKGDNIERVDNIEDLRSVVNRLI